MEDQIPDTPIATSTPAPHRRKLYKRRWPFNACVARPVSKKELFATPAALEARDKEWQKLIDKPAWDFNTVQPRKKVMERAKREGIRVHFSSPMDLCHVKHSELAKIIRRDEL